MKFKSLLLLLIALPLWIFHIPAGDSAAAGHRKRVGSDEEKPFVLLATVHNYGYVEPCG
jgi:hypothetical protein